MDRLVEMSPPGLRWIMDFSAETAREHRDVIRRFGRHPHKGTKCLDAFQRQSELEYLAKGDFAHTRAIRGP
jgi:uncharacterized protein (DUF924 family)